MVNFISNNLTGIIEIIVALWGVIETRRQTEKMPPGEQHESHEKTKTWWHSKPIIAMAILVVLGWVPTIMRQLNQTPDFSAQASYFRAFDKQNVSNQTFIDEQVVLDGKSFVNDDFENVTLVYDGTAPFDLIGNNFAGSVNLSSDSPEILTMLKFLSTLGFIRYPSASGCTNSSTPNNFH